MNKKLSKAIMLGVIMAAFFAAFLSLFGQAGQTPAVLGLKERAEVFDRWLKIRLESVLPEIMRRENIDMRVVICREYNEDPVYLTLVPYSSMSARSFRPRTAGVWPAWPKIDKNAAKNAAMITPRMIGLDNFLFIQPPRACP